jgi:hypothetical protein
MNDLETRYPIKTRNSAKGRTPWAYDPKGGDPNIFLPNWDRVKLLEQAFDYLEEGTMSLRKATEWLVVETGKELSHQGLRALYLQYRPDSERLKTLRLKKELIKQQKLTREQRKEKTLTKKIQIARAKATMAQKRKERLERIKEVPSEASGILDYSSFSVPEDREVIFTPNEGPQTEFLAASEVQVLYGGAAGGGKSYALLADPMRYFSFRNFNGLLLRRTNDELRELIWKSKELYPAVFPGARWSEKKSSWSFPSGAQLWLTYLERDDDVLRYQGQSFTWIGFDELTQYPTPFPWNYLYSRLRTTDPALKDSLSMRATTNPGGPGHGWVKRMFIDPAVPGKAFIATDIENGEQLVHPATYPPTHPKAGQPNPRAGEPLFYRKFIPASLYDNPHLANDGQYESTLLSLPEQQRRQLLEGDWNVADGAAFSEFREQIHVVEPFDIPSEWRKFRSCDFGYSSHSAVHWFAVDPDENLIVYRELYASKMTAIDLARAILSLERGENISYGVLDSSCWHQRGHLGPSIAEEMIREGCRWRPSDRTQGSRVAGKNRLHELLKTDERGIPGIRFFNTCRQIISDLPVIPADPKGSDDIDDRYTSDHTYDSVRYGIMTRPRSKSPFEDWFKQKPFEGYKPSDSVFGY